jgi:hypothetical protein
MRYRLAMSGQGARQVHRGSRIPRSGLADVLAIRQHAVSSFLRTGADQSRFLTSMNPGDASRYPAASMA